MTTAITFRKEVIIKEGMSAYAVYVADVQATAPYALHIEMDGEATASPSNLTVAHKSGGEDYQVVYRTALDTLKAHAYTFDHDFAGEAWPKQVRITTPLPVLSASITTGSASSEDIEQIKAQLKELTGSTDSTAASTPAIDSNKEVKDFLEGYDNTQKLKDVIKDSQVSVDEAGEALILG